MYVCLCHNVNDSTIEKAIEQGATTMKCLSSDLKVGTQCGKCIGHVKRVLNDKLIQLAGHAKQVA